MSGNQQFDQALKALSLKFSGELPHKLGEIQRLVHAVADNHTDNSALLSLHRTLHGLAAAANTFGYPQLTDVARRLEQHVIELIHAGPRAGSGVTALQMMLDELLDRALTQKAA